MVKKFENIFNRFDRILACDRQTERQMDGQTSWGSIIHAMYSIVRYNTVLSFPITEYSACLSGKRPRADTEQSGSDSGEHLDAIMRSVAAAVKTA